MRLLLWIAGPTAAGIHVLIFAMESLWFRRAAVYRRFGVRGDLPETTRLFARNQGFYNLFLAVGLGVGLALLATGRDTAGSVLVAWNAGSMCAAALVLLGTAPRLWRGALVQGVPPALALVGLLT